VYLQVETEDTTLSQFLCSKTRVAPVKKVTIPRLELLSALLLARLVSTVQRALEAEIQLSDVACHTDSQVTLYWIIGKDREWKQFVQNRVMEIREPVSATSWRYCPGAQNPADIPSRGVFPFDLQEKLRLWLHGPQGSLHLRRHVESEEAMTMPRECLSEMKASDREELTVNLLTSNVSTTVLPCENFSSLTKLLRVTAYILKFINVMKDRVHSSGASSQADCILTAEDIHLALTYWLKVSQSSLAHMKNFPLWGKQFGLFQDGAGLWRCGGRLNNSGLPQATKHPILLNKEHHLSLLIVFEEDNRKCSTDI